MKIKFQQDTPRETPTLLPVPAIQELPEWYKKMSPYTEGDKPKFWGDGTKNLTIKRCNPVGDALGAGYFIRLENTIHVEEHESGIPKLVWHRGGEQYISEHGQIQIDKDLVPNGFSGQPFKFRNLWSIQTPPGYSIMVTHPLNRNAEPFLTLSGVVDTDTYQTAVQLPFLLRKNFEGFIEAGTPIAQVIPFKRESWQSEILEHDAFDYENRLAQFQRTMYRYYKRFHWKRKEFK